MEDIEKAVPNTLSEDAFATKVAKRALMDVCRLLVAHLNSSGSEFHLDYIELYEAFFNDAKRQLLESDKNDIGGQNANE